MAKFMLLRLAALVVAVAGFTGCGLIYGSPSWVADASADADASTTPDNGVVGSDGGSLDSATSTDVAVEEPKGGCPTSQRPDATVEVPLDGSDGPQYLCLSADSAEEELVTTAKTAKINAAKKCNELNYGSSMFCDFEIAILVPKDPAASLRIRFWWPDLDDTSAVEMDIYCKDSVCTGEITGSLFDGALKGIRITFDVPTKQISVTITWTETGAKDLAYKFDLN